jgi:hypothetical protein
MNDILHLGGSVPNELAAPPGNFSKPSRAGEVSGDGVGKRGTRTPCTTTNLTNLGIDKFARAAGL